MKSVGHVATVAFGSAVVVSVEMTLAAQIGLTIAGLMTPFGVLLSFLSVDQYGPLGRETWVPALMVAMGIVLALIFVVVSVRGTVQARLLVNNEEVDRLRWFTAPDRKLKAKIDEHEIEAEISIDASRLITFHIDGGALKARELV